MKYPIIRSETVMPMNFLGKVFFPRLAPWQRKKQAKIMLWVLFATGMLAICIVTIMFFQNSKR